MAGAAQHVYWDYLVYGIILINLFHHYESPPLTSTPPPYLGVPPIIHCKCKVPPLKSMASNPEIVLFWAAILFGAQLCHSKSGFQFARCKLTIPKGANMEIRQIDKQCLLQQGFWMPQGCGEEEGGCSPAERDAGARLQGRIAVTGLPPDRKQR